MDMLGVLDDGLLDVRGAVFFNYEDISRGRGPLEGEKVAGFGFWELSGASFGREGDGTLVSGNYPIWQIFCVLNFPPPGCATESSGP